MIDLKKMAAVRDAINDVRGPLSFFAIFLIEDTDQWDVVVAGPNIREDNFDHLKIVSAEVVRILKPQEMRDVRRVVLFDEDFEPLQAFMAADIDRV